MGQNHRFPGLALLLVTLVISLLATPSFAADNAATKSGDKIPPPPPEVTDPATLILLNDSEEWTGNIKLAEGLYHLDHRIGIGTLNPDVAGHVTSGSNIVIEASEIVLRVGDW